MVLHYDETDLVRKLSPLPVELQVAFAAASAERLLPSYTTFSKRAGRGDPAALTEILERIWRDLVGEKMDVEQRHAALERCMSLIPGEDDEPWVDEQAYADDAASAVAYALRALVSGEPQEAAWAARRAYEALDHFVINREDIDTNQPGAEEEVIAHPILQAELARQQRDLQELLGAASTEDTKALIARLRSRSRAEAAIFFRG